MCLTYRTEACFLNYIELKAEAHFCQAYSKQYSHSVSKGDYHPGYDNPVLSYLGKKMNDWWSTKGSWTSNQKAWLFLRRTLQAIFCRVSLPSSTWWWLHSLNVTTSLPCLQIFRWVWSVVEGGKDTNSSPKRVQGTVGLAVHSPGLVHPGLLWAGCISYLKFTVPLGALWVSATSSSPSGLYQPSLSGYPQWFPYPFVIIPFITFSSKYPKFLPASLWYTDQLELWDTSISLFTYLSVILFSI